MARTPTTAAYGDVFVGPGGDDETLIYLPFADGSPWLNPATGDWYDDDDIDWDKFQHTHQLIPVDGGDSDA